MKKLKLAFAFVLLFYGVANAQSLGLQVGANFSKYTLSSSDKFVLQPGLLIGPVVELGLSENVGLKSGLLFTVKGDKRVYSGTILPKMEYSVHYAQVPLSLIFKKDLKIVTLYLQAGPYLGYAISGNKWVDDVKSALDFDDVDFSDRLDLGIGVGAGVEISRFWMGINFESGFTDVYDYATSTGKNLTGSVVIGYKLFNH